MFYFYFEVVFHFFQFFSVVFSLTFFLRLSSIFFGVCLSCWVKVWLHTENQLPGLPGSALRVAHQQHGVSWVGWGGGGGPTHYVVATTQVEVELGCDNN
jgi:hypothetical protein